MELLRDRQGRDQQGQEARTAHAHDLQPDPCNGFRRPLRTPPCAVVARRVRRAVRPLCLHGVRARRHARLPAGMGPRQLQFRRAAGFDDVFQGRPGSVAEPHFGRPPEIEIFRGGHGFESFERSLRKLQDFPRPHPRAIHGDEQRIQFHRDGRQPARGKTTGARPQDRQREARTEEIQAQEPVAT